MIYFIQQGNDGPIKIGYSKNPEERMRVLQTTAYEKLKLILSLPGDRTEEALLHNEFKNCRLDGEWFNPSPELVRFINNPVGLLFTPKQEIAEVCLNSKQIYKQYKKGKSLEDAGRKLDVFHEIRRSRFEKVLFWLKHRKYFAWKQIADKEVCRSTVPFPIIRDIHIPELNDGSLKANASGNKWYYHPAFHFDYLYSDDVWQFFPQILNKNGKELLDMLQSLKCSCGGNLEYHYRDCHYHSDTWMGSASYFIRLTNKSVWLNISIENWELEEIEENPNWGETLRTIMF